MPREFLNQLRRRGAETGLDELTDIPDVEYAQKRTIEEEPDAVRQLSRKRGKFTVRLGELEEDVHSDTASLCDSRFAKRLATLRWTLRKALQRPQADRPVQVQRANVYVGPKSEMRALPTKSTDWKDTVSYLTGTKTVAEEGGLDSTFCSISWLGRTIGFNKLLEKNRKILDELLLSATVPVDRQSFVIKALMNLAEERVNKGDGGQLQPPQSADRDRIVEDRLISSKETELPLEERLSMAWTISVIRYVAQTQILRSLIGREGDVMHGRENEDDYLICMVEQHAAQGLLKGMLLGAFSKQNLIRLCKSRKENTISQTFAAMTMYLARLLSLPSNDFCTYGHVEEIASALHDILGESALNVQDRVCDVLLSNMISCRVPSFEAFLLVLPRQHIIVDTRNLVDMFVLTQVPALYVIGKGREAPVVTGSAGLFELCGLKKNLRDPYLFLMRMFRLGGEALVQTALLLMLDDCVVQGESLVDERDWRHLNNSFKDAAIAQGGRHKQCNALVKSILSLTLQLLLQDSFASPMGALESSLWESQFEIDADIGSCHLRSPEKSKDVVGDARDASWTKLLSSSWSKQSSHSSTSTRKSTLKGQGNNPFDWKRFLASDALRNILPLMTVQSPIVNNILIHNFDRVKETLPSLDDESVQVHDRSLHLERLLTKILTLGDDAVLNTVAENVADILSSARVARLDLNDEIVLVLNNRALLENIGSMSDRKRPIVFLAFCQFFRLHYLLFGKNVLYSFEHDGATIVHSALGDVVKMAMQDDESVLKKGASSVLMMIVGSGLALLETCFEQSGINLADFPKLLKSLPCVDGTIEGQGSFSSLLRRRLAIFSNKFLVRMVRQCDVATLVSSVASTKTFSGAALQERLVQVLNLFPVEEMLRLRPSFSVVTGAASTSLAALYASASPLVVGHTVMKKVDSFIQGEPCDCVVKAIIAGALLRFNRHAFVRKQDFIVGSVLVGSWVNACMQQENLPLNLDRAKVLSVAGRFCLGMLENLCGSEVPSLASALELCDADSTSISGLNNTNSFHIMSMVIRHISCAFFDESIPKGASVFRELNRKRDDIKNSFEHLLGKSAHRVWPLANVQTFCSQTFARESALSTALASWICTIQGLTRYNQMFQYSPLWSIEIVEYARLIDKCAIPDSEECKKDKTLRRVTVECLVEYAAGCIETFVSIAETEASRLVQDVRQRSEAAGGPPQRPILDGKQQADNSKSLDIFISSNRVLSQAKTECEIKAADASKEFRRLLASRFNLFRAHSLWKPSGVTSSLRTGQGRAGQPLDDDQDQEYPTNGSILSMVSPWAPVEDYGTIPDQDVKGALARFFGVEFGVPWSGERR